MEDDLKYVRNALSEMKAKVINKQTEKSRDSIVSSVASEVSRMFAPVLERIADSSRSNRQELVDAIKEIKIEAATPEISVNVPDVNVPEIKVPEPRVSVTVPPIRVPEVKMPEEMNIKGWVSLMGVDLNNPLPVQLRDAKGNPINVFDNLTQIISGGGGGGGKHDHFMVRGFDSSAFADYLNSDNRLRVSVETGGSGLTDTELRATAVPVSQVSGANWSTNITNTDLDIRDLVNATDSVSAYQVSGAIWSTAVIDIFGSTAAASVFNADNRIKVSVETGGSGLTDAELRATAVPVSQVSGATWSTEVTNTVTVSATDLDIRDLANATDSVRVYQLSGASWSVEATQSGTWNVGTVTTVTGVTNSVSAAIVDSGGVQYSGSNPVPITIVSGALTSTIVVGPVASDAVDDNSGPVQVGGIARTANPTAVAAGDAVKATHDDLGRQVLRPVQVRDLIATAYVQLTNGTETTLLAASAGSFHDLIYVMGANNSDVAVSVDIRPVTAGNVVMTIQIPASGTAGIACPVPLPQSASDTGNNWTADMSDITGTTVSLTALFSREV